MDTRMTSKLGAGRKFTNESGVAQMKKLILYRQNPEFNLASLSKLNLSANFFPRYNDVEFHTTLGNFLNLVASQLENFRVEVSESSELKFDEDSYKNIGMFRRLQTLETVVTKACRCHDTKRGGFLFVPNLIGPILQKSPVLWKLSISWSSIFKLNWPNLGEKVIRNIPESVHRLDISLRFGANDYEIFGSLLLPNLTSLSLTLYSDVDIPGIKIHNLFSNYKNITLRELDLQLQITECFVSVTGGFKLPTFPNLTTLKFGTSICIARDTEYDDMIFPVIFPKVTDLELRTSWSGLLFRRVFFISGVTVPQVKTLYSQICTLGMEFYNWYAGFTGLTKMVVRLENNLHYLEPLRRIFMDRKGLKHLELEFDHSDFIVGEFENVDFMLTGIPVPICETIQDNPNWTEVQLSTIKDAPGISDLTNLKTLSIHSKVPIHITDVTAYLGILQLPELEKLSIENFKMSQTCIANLKLKFGDPVIDLRKRTIQKW